jgi:hypothetical protein
MDILTYINKMNRLYGSEPLAPWDKPEVPWWEEKHEPGPWDEQQVARFGTQETYGAPEELSPMPNWRDLIREEGVQVGQQVKDGGRIYDTRKYFKPGGLVEPGVTRYGDYEITKKKNIGKWQEIKRGPNTGKFSQRIMKDGKVFLKIVDKKPPLKDVYSVTVGSSDVVPRTKRTITGSKDYVEKEFKKYKQSVKEFHQYDYDKLQKLVTEANAGDKFVTSEDIRKKYFKGAEEGAERVRMYTPAAAKIFQTLDSREEKVERVLKDLLISDEPMKVGDLRKVITQKTGVAAGNTLKTILDNSPTFKTIAKEVKFLSGISGTQIKDMSLMDQLDYAYEAAEGRPRFTGVGGKSRIAMSPTYKVMDFARRSWNQHQGKGAVQFLDAKGDPIKWAFGKNIKYKNAAFKYKGKIYDLKTLNQPGFLKANFPEVYKNQTQINKLLLTEVDNPFPDIKGEKIEFKKLMKKIQVDGYGWKHGAASMDILHGKKGVALEPFTNLSFGTKDVNMALNHLEKIPLKGLQTKIYNQVLGSLKGLEGQKLADEIIKQQSKIGKQVASGVTFPGTRRIRTYQELLKTGDLGAGEEKFVAKILSDNGFKCKLQGGLTCNDPRAYIKSINEQKALALANDAKAISKFNKVGTAVKAARGISKFTLWGILGEVAFAPLIALPMLSKGESWSRVMNDISWGAFGQSAQEELIASLPKGSLGAAQMKTLETSERAQKLAERTFPGARIGMDPKRFDLAQYQVKEAAEQDVRDAIKPFVVNGVFDYEAFEKAGGDVEATKVQLEKDKLARKESRWYARDKLDPTEEMVGFDAGGRVPFGKGKLAITTVDKGRRAFMKWLAGITGAGVVAGTGLLKFGKTIGTGKTAIKAGDHIIQSTPGMPDWFIPLINRIVREGDDVTKKLGTKEREIVHTKNIEGHDVDVYQDLDTGNIRVSVEGGTGKNLTAYDEGLELEYKAPEVIEEGMMKGQKTKPEFGTSEMEASYTRTGPDDADLDFQFSDQSTFPPYKNLDRGEIVNPRGSTGTTSISDTNFLKNYAKKKKPNMGEIVQTTKKKKEIKYLKENPHEDPRIPEWNDPGDEHLFDEFGNYIGD